MRSGVTIHLQLHEHDIGLQQRPANKADNGSASASIFFDETICRLHLTAFGELRDRGFSDNLFVAIMVLLCDSILTIGQ